MGGLGEQIERADIGQAIPGSQPGDVPGQCGGIAGDVDQSPRVPQRVHHLESQAGSGWVQDHRAGGPKPPDQVLDLAGVAGYPFSRAALFRQANRPAVQLDEIIRRVVADQRGS